MWYTAGMELLICSRCGTSDFALVSEPWGEEPDDHITALCASCGAAFPQGMMKWRMQPSAREAGETDT